MAEQPKIKVRNEKARRRWLEAFSKVRFAVKTINIWQSVSDAAGAGASSGDGGNARRASAILKELHSRSSSKSLIPKEEKSANEDEEKRLHEEYRKELAEKQVAKSLPILKKDPKDRNDDDINSLLDLVRGVKFFEELSLHLRFSVCRVMKYKMLCAKKIVFRQGDAGNSFFVILRGSVDILVRHRGIKYTACSLYPGQSFGELALINSAPRSATVRATMDSEFVVIEKADYNAVLKKMHELARVEKLRLLRRVHSFRDWSDSELKQLSEKARLRSFSDNGIVCQEGGQRECLHIVKRGVCRILKMVRASGSGPRKEIAWIEVSNLWPRDYFGEAGLFESLYGDDKRSSMRIRRRNSFKINKAGVNTRHADASTSSPLNPTQNSGAHGRHVASVLAKGYVEVMQIKLETIAQIVGDRHEKLETLKQVSQIRLNFLDDCYLVKESLDASRAWNRYKEKLIPSLITFNGKHRAALQSKKIPCSVMRGRYYPVSTVALANTTTHNAKSCKTGLECCSSCLPDSCIVQVNATNHTFVAKVPQEKNHDEAPPKKSSVKRTWKYKARKYRPSNSVSVMESLQKLPSRPVHHRSDIIPRTTKEMGTRIKMGSSGSVASTRSIGQPVSPRRPR